MILDYDEADIVCLLKNYFCQANENFFPNSDNRMTHLSLFDDQLNAEIFEEGHLGAVGFLPNSYFHTCIIPQSTHLSLLYD